MATKTIETTTGWASDRCPVITLDCGHKVYPDYIIHRGTCADCGSTIDFWTIGKQECMCGSTSATELHRVSDDIMIASCAIPDSCPTCREIADDVARIPDLVKRSIYARYRDSSIYFYERDPKSPSGINLIGGVIACQETEDAIDLTGGTVLSPTEGLRSVR